ncbi:hypothetical protein P691DRAFT_807125 [Macrolepiota fuliginosa MF-IS2]|uniref:Uncharacterized protein n=1 Tax=Macrolepiota fuliginosa MF-IS2 TaxID=1400762 RepID=A0A9P5X4E1_9AGAR|nr:hypothetical protein P691DRAFT_807125 [Macrolepiota fuliginosa MF-IS2]
MEYQFTRGIQRPNAARLSLALSSMLHDSLMVDIQREITRGGGYQEQPKGSSTLTVPMKTPYSVLSSGSAYSQDSWVGPEAWAFNKPSPSFKLATSGAPVVTRSLISQEPLLPTPLLTHPHSSSSISATSHDSEAPLGSRSPVRSPPVTDSSSNPNIALGAVIEDKIGLHDDGREKKAKLKQMYRRASMSTKAFKKMFSRTSSGLNRGPPPGGITKRTSLKSPPKDHIVDPFASGSSVSSYGLSPVETSPPSQPLLHKRNVSSPVNKPPLSIDVQTHLRRSPSISSPLGIPASPSLNKYIEQSGQVRGRDMPFPLNASEMLSPPPRSTSQNSTVSTRTQRTISTSSQNLSQRPLPERPLSTSLRGHVRQLPHVPVINEPSLGAPVAPLPPTVILGPSPFDILKRSRSKSVRETERPRNLIQTRNETVSRLPRHDLQPSAYHRDEGRVTIDDGKQSFLEISTPRDASSQTLHGSNGPRTEHGTVRARVVAYSPSMPSMRAAFLGSGDANILDTLKQGSRAGSATGNVQTDLGPPITDSRDLPEGSRNKAETTSVRVGPVSQSSTASANASRDPLSRTNHQTDQKPTVPQISTQGLLPPGNQRGEAVSNRSLRSQRSMRSVPRSPSLPSIRPEFSEVPPLPLLGTTSYQRSFESTHGTHLRSPSLPNIPAGTSQNSRRQPLPSAIAERLRNRVRTDSGSGVRRPPVDSLAAHPRDAKKPTLEPIPSASLDQSSRTSAFSVMAQPPISPSVTPPLRIRATKRSRSASLASPSMPDLRVAANKGSISSRGITPNRRPPSPPPPLPQPQHQLYTRPLLPDPLPTDAFPGSDSLSFTNLFLRPKPNLTRPKEFSYPPSKDVARAFHARSNKELAREGDWDFLDTPPRPPRSPSDSPHPTSRMVSNSMKGDRDPRTPHAVAQLERAIGMAV